MTTMPFAIRPANPADRAALAALHGRALRVLSWGHIRPEAIETVVATLGTLDDHLLRDGTYFVATVGDRIVASGGWSLAAPSYARVIGGVEVGGELVPTVRAMYVDPALARQGLGRAMLAYVEAAIIDAGWRRAVLMASPMGLPFYLRCGWRPLATVGLALAGGHKIPSHEMDKLLVLPAQPFGAPRAIPHTGLERRAA